jgi:hypothetical protein
MPNIQDGPKTPLFTPITLEGNTTINQLVSLGISDEMSSALEYAPVGNCTSWGIPFEIEELVALREQVVLVQFSPKQAQWLIFMHTSDLRPFEPGSDGFISPMRGEGQLGEHAADYVIRYADGIIERIPIRRRYQLGIFHRRWGENCLEAVAHRKPRPTRAPYEQTGAGWIRSRTLVSVADTDPWVNWLWAWENPYPEKEIVEIRFEPVKGVIIVSAVSAGNASSNPLRWQPRQKALMSLPQGEAFQPALDESGLLHQFQLDMGQIISATSRPLYPDTPWEKTYNNQRPEMSENQLLIEYTAHPEARFYFSDGRIIPLREVAGNHQTPQAASKFHVQMVPPARRRVTLRTVERNSGQAVPAKLHIHGEWDEYLAPIDRHRTPNPTWFDDYSLDFVHGGEYEDAGNNLHYSTYISGETRVDLPLGRVYIEVAKGFEVQPIRTVVEVAPDTQEIIIELEKVLNWREQGWVTADTHVHFLSPTSALLEGAAEGVNVVNLLASQWGELMSNVGDFDGKTTWGSREAGGDGEYLVRVGTENRQHVLGHISLLGYKGQIITPMATGGPNESALGDSIEILLTEWARQCKKQGGLVVIPHFPDPRLENAAVIVSGYSDAIEMTSWGRLYDGINPYSLADWYRYLNCGYLIPAVGGTDKMSANTPVGAVRTYSRIDPNQIFTYETWMEAVRRAETFVTYGPLLQFTVDGYSMGSRIEMSTSGGTVEVEWQAASITVPMSRVELVVNGEIRESAAVAPEQASGSWSVKVDKSSWLALLIRGHYSDKPEIIVAHSSPVMVLVENLPMVAAADMVTILEQIEGAIAYLDTTGTRADDRSYKRMRLKLTAAHRQLHNRMHQAGFYHDHTPATDQKSS